MTATMTDIIAADDQDYPEAMEAVMAAEDEGPCEECGWRGPDVLAVEYRYLSGRFCPDCRREFEYASSADRDPRE